MNLGDSQNFDNFLTRNTTAQKEARSPTVPGATGSVANSLGFQTQIF